MRRLVAGIRIGCAWAGMSAAGTTAFLLICLAFVLFVFGLVIAYMGEML